MRLARLCGQQRSLGRKRRRGWRRRRPAPRPGARVRQPAAAWPPRSRRRPPPHRADGKHAGMRRRYGRDRRHRLARNQLPRHRDGVPGNRFRAGECRRGHRGHRSGRLAIAIDDVGDVDVVVDVVDHGGVDHRIAHVDVVEILPARRVARSIHFARSEREPADARDRTGRQRQAEAAAADEGHQRRGVHRAHGDRAGHPAPARLHVRPAAIVERREAPWRIVDPGPAPGIDPGPVPVVIRAPNWRALRLETRRCRSPRPSATFRCRRDPNNRPCPGRHTAPPPLRPRDGCARSTSCRIRRGPAARRTSNRAGLRRRRSLAGRHRGCRPRLRRTPRPRRCARARPSRCRRDRHRCDSRRCGGWKKPGSAYRSRRTGRDRCGARAD